MIVAVSAILILLFSLAGAAAMRMHGGGGPDLGKWFDRFFALSLFAVAIAPISEWYALLAYLGMAGIATGHGMYSPALMAKYIPPKNIENFDFIVKWFYGDDPRTDTALAGQYENSAVITLAIAGYKNLASRCRFGRFVTGSIVGLPSAAMAFDAGEPLFALPFLLTGVCKALAYDIGWRWKASTEYGEALTGATWGLICGVVFVVAVWG